MFAVGHIALGYIIGKPLNRAIDHNLNIPVLWALSLLPDIDFFIPGLPHRGPTHSLIVAFVIFIPLFLLWSKNAVPYFIALVTHSLIGDYITNGGIMLFWPLSSEWVKHGTIIILGSALETYIELGLFLIFISTLIVSKDFNHLFDSDLTNTVLFIPLCTIFLPTFFRYPINIPEILIIPHLILLSMLALSFSMSLIPAASSITKNRSGILVKKSKREVNFLHKEEDIKKLKQLEQNKEQLQAELRKLKRKPEGKIGYLLLILGLTLISLAIYYEHNVSAFIGIALTFWGALLLFIRPNRFIRNEVLNSTLLEPLKYTHKLLDELEFRGTPIYISPGTLRGMRSATLYIPKSDQSNVASDEQLSSEETFIKNPSAIKLTPPGLGLSRLLEDELKTNFSTVDLEYLQYNMEKALIEGLEIVEAFEMEASESAVRVEMRGNIFEEITGELDELEAHRRIGDPLTSAIACILARTIRRPIIIEKVEREQKKRTIQITFNIVDSKSEEETNQS